MTAPVSDEELAVILEAGQTTCARVSVWLNRDGGRRGELGGDAWALVELMRTATRPGAGVDGFLALDERLPSTDLAARRREAEADRRELALAGGG